MPRPRIITDEKRERLLAVVLLRERIPSDKQLAEECGVSVSAIRQAMTLMRMLHDSADTEPKDSANIAESWPSLSHQQQSQTDASSA